MRYTDYSEWYTFLDTIIDRSPVLLRMQITASDNSGNEHVQQHTIHPFCFSDAQTACQLGHRLGEDQADPANTHTQHQLGSFNAFS